MNSGLQKSRGRMVTGSRKFRSPVPRPFGRLSAYSLPRAIFLLLLGYVTQIYSSVFSQRIYIQDFHHKGGLGEAPLNRDMHQDVLRLLPSSRGRQDPYVIDSQLCVLGVYHAIEVLCLWRRLQVVRQTKRQKTLKMARFPSLHLRRKTHKAHRSLEFHITLLN